MVAFQIGISFFPMGPPILTHAFAVSFREGSVLVFGAFFDSLLKKMFHPKYPDPSNLAILRTYPFYTGSFTLPLEGPMILIASLLLTQPMHPEKKSLNFIFTTRYVIPKSLKFSHWPSKSRWLIGCFLWVPSERK